jgi:mono/diheme cytochrome c family protein
VEGALYVFWPDRAAIMRGGRTAAVRTPGAAWAGAAAAPALDGEGTWVVGRTTAGGLVRVMPNGDLEPVEDRLGLPARVRSFAATGATIAALHDGLAIVRDRHVLAFGEPRRGDVIAGGDRLAVRDGARLQVWNLARMTRVRYEVPAARAAVFVGARLAVATDDDIFIESDRGMRPLRAPGRIRAITASGAHLWLIASSTLYRLDGARFTRVSSAVDADALFALASGDVALVSPTALQRITVARGDATWDARVRPIFDRVCAACHLPDGRAGVDLSTAASWSTHRAVLVERVVTTRTMPPPGVALSDEDRRALADYLGR